MISVTWNIEPTVQALRSLIDRMRDLRPAWKSVVLYLRKATQATFASQGGRIGAAWAPLSPDYAYQKERVYPGMPILRASDGMYKSLVDEGAENSIVEIGLQDLTYGTKDRKARWHQDGTDRMPQRKILDVVAEDRRQIKAIVRAHLQRQATISGFEVL